MGIVYDKILEKLSSLNPVEMQVIDETYKHAGHFQGEATETHFRINIIAAAFQGISRVERHKVIYRLLDFELKNHIHALAIKAFAPEEISTK